MKLHELNLQLGNFRISHLKLVYYYSTIDSRLSLLVTELADARVCLYAIMCTSGLLSTGQGSASVINYETYNVNVLNLTHNLLLSEKEFHRWIPSNKISTKFTS